MKLFEPRFVAIGVMYTVFALLLMILGWLRSELGRRDFERTDDKIFVTPGSVVFLTSKHSRARSLQSANPAGYTSCISDHVLN